MAKTKSTGESTLDGDTALTHETTDGTSGGETAPHDPRGDIRVYVGPTLHRRAIVEASVFRGGLSAHVSRLIEKIPELETLIVPLSGLSEAKKCVKEPGTAENGIYQYLSAIRFDNDGEVRQ